MNGDRSAEMDAFVAEARNVEIFDAFMRSGFSLQSLRRAGAGSGAELYGPCPACGGTDRFAMNPRKQKFICRGGAAGGALTMVMHLTGARYLEACEIALGRDRPTTAALSPQERARLRREAEARAEASRREAERRASEAARAAETYREDELDRCRRDWREAHGFVGSSAERYLQARGLPTDRLAPQALACHPSLVFSHKPKVGPHVTLHRGAAMLARFLVPEIDGWRMIGLHRTWIDLAAAPKFRPQLADPDDPEGDPLPTKKMRGSKAGGLIPLVGRWSAAPRMVAGEGIETVIGFAAREGFREDTFYAAAGDLGNLCGSATRESRVRVPGAVKLDRRGRGRPVFVPGEVPDMESVCMPVPEHVDELVLLGDGDSEPTMTRVAIQRGLDRHARYGRTTLGVMAPAGTDWGEAWRDVAAA